MKPYFDTSHLAGALILVAVLCWAMIEAAHLGNSRQEATKVGGAGRRIAAWTFLTAASAVLYLAPPLVPAAAIRPAAVAFAIGFVILLAGLLWRIHAEERALLTTLGDPYRAYAARHKRLVPLVW
jgi:protein-S-isoprenylcysteine O-methyltransferase Ste14